MNKFKKLVSSLGKAFWPVLLKLLEDKTVEFALKKILGVGLAATGFKVWIIKFLAKNFAQEIVIPSANAALAEGKYVFYKHEGKILIKRLEEADNAQDYNDVVDDILS